MAKSGTSSGRATRQSKRLNPKTVVQENASTEVQSKEDGEHVQKVKEDQPEREAREERDWTDVKPESESVKDKGSQSESGLSDVNAEDEVKAESEDFTTEVKDKQDAKDAELETIIEVKSSRPTVCVSWEKDVEPDESRTVSTEISSEEQVETTSPDAEDDTKLPLEEEVKDEGDVEMESSASEKTEQEAERDEEEEAERDEEEEAERDEEEEAERDEEEEAERDEEEEAQSDKEEEAEEETTDEKVVRKRKSKSSVDSCPEKKVRVINDGYCLYVGNLNNSKYYEEIKNALAKYFMAQSLLVQDIQLDKAKKFAFVDLASQMDLTKALTLDGQELLDKPLKVAKAKVKEVEMEKKKKDAQEVQKRKNERCIHVENIPSSATKEDVLKVFPKAIAVRFLGGTDNPSKGVAFVEFQNKRQAVDARSVSGTAQIETSVLQVNVVKETAGVQGVRRVKRDSKKNKKAHAPPSDTLFVSNLPGKVSKENLQKIFKKAVQINIPQRDGKSRGYAFVEFASVAHAENALSLSKNKAIHKKPLKVQFSLKSRAEQMQVASKSLIVLGLDEKTTAVTLAEAFEGALASRILMDKETGLSKKFGFVDFESADSCRKAKDAAEDIKIDGCKVTVAFARPKGSQGPDGEMGPTVVKRRGSQGLLPKKAK